MHDNDTFRLIDKDGAVLILVLAIGAAAAIFSVEEPKSQPAKPKQQNCEVSIAQYGPGERWSPLPPLPACAGAVVSVPNHILTKPIQDQQ